MPTIHMDQIATINLPDRYGKTRLYKASWGRETQAVEFLVASGAKIDADDREGHTLLHCAVMAGDVAWATLLLDHGADPDLVGRADRQTPLAYAVSGGHTLLAETLRARGARET